MLRELAIVVLVPVVALLAWLALGGAPERADFALTSPEPRTLDPQRVSWIREIQFAAAMFEGLTRTSGEAYLPEPAVASRWDVNDDQIRQQVEVALKAGVSGYFVCYSPIEQSWEPRIFRVDK